MDFFHRKDRNLTCQISTDTVEKVHKVKDFKCHAPSSESTEKYHLVTFSGE